jgi:ATP-binding cassette subfamily G (WHITE) protein 2 (SNQ2)
MFAAKSGAMFQESAERHEPSRTPLHNVDEAQAHPEGTDEASHGHAAAPAQDGTWGERDVGGPVDFQGAMQEFEVLRHELTHLSKTRTQKAEESRHHPPQGLGKTITNTSRHSRTAPDLEAQDKETEVGEDDVEAESGDFELGDFLREGHFEKRDADKSAKKVGVIYKNLTVQGVGATAVFVKTLPAAIVGVSVSIPILVQWEEYQPGPANFQTKLGGSGRSSTHKLYLEPTIRHVCRTQVLYERSADCLFS